MIDYVLFALVITICVIMILLVLGVILNRVIDFVGPEKRGDNYLVRFTRPDGVEFQLLVPQEGTYEWAVDKGGEFGLNLVTNEHYS